MHRFHPRSTLFPYTTLFRSFNTRCPHMPPSSSAAARVQQDSRRQEVLSAQIGLLYANANIGVGVTLLAATTLALLQRGIVPKDRKSTRLNSSHITISYAVFC